MSISSPVTVALGVGPEDVVYPRFWIGGTVNARGQVLTDDGTAIQGQGVTFLWRRPDGVQVEIAGVWDEAAATWRCAYEPDWEGTGAVRLKSLSPQRQTAWQIFDVVTAPADAPPPPASIWVSQADYALATGNGGLISAVRIADLPRAPVLDQETVIPVVGRTSSDDGASLDTLSTTLGDIQDKASAAAAEHVLPQARQVAAEESQVVAQRVTQQLAPGAGAAAGQLAGQIAGAAAGQSAAQAVVATKADREDRILDELASPRVITERFADRVNLEDYRKVPGSGPGAGTERSDRETFYAAIKRAKLPKEIAVPLYLGPRRYTISGASLPLVSRFSLFGVAGQTILQCDPASRTQNNLFFFDPVAQAVANGDTRPLYEITQDLMANPVEYLIIDGVKFEGNWGKGDPASPGQFLFSEQGPALFVAKCVRRLELRNFEAEGSRAFSMQPRICSEVIADNFRVTKSNRDGFAAWDTDVLRITNGTIMSTNDDAISAQQMADAPARSKLILDNVTLVDCNGINVAAFKMVEIGTLVCDRIHQCALYGGVTTPAAGTGDTPNIGLSIGSLSVYDPLPRDWYVGSTTPENRAASRHRSVVMIQQGAGEQTGGLPVPPGRNDPATGYTIDPAGHYWNLRVNLEGKPAPASEGVWMGHLAIRRTRQPVAKYSDWRAETAGRADDPSGDNRYKAFGGPYGWLDYPVTENNLSGIGLELRAPLRRVRVDSFDIDVRFKGVLLTRPSEEPATSLKDDLFREVVFSNGTLYGGNQGAVAWSPVETSFTKQDITFNFVTFDVDPLRTSTQRRLVDGKPDGSWLSGGAPYAIDTPFIGGIHTNFCTFRNCAKPINETGVPAGMNVHRGDILQCDPAAVGFSAANKGIGNCPAPGDAWWYEIYGCDPREADFGLLRNQCFREIALGTSALSDIFGTAKYVKGMRVRVTDAAVSPEGLAGDLIRLTTGTGHTTGSAAGDWAQLHHNWGSKGVAPYPSTLVLRASGAITPEVRAQGPAGANLHIGVTPLGTGQVQLNGPTKLPAFTVATLPAIVANTGCEVKVSDRGYRTATSNGTAWTWADGTAVS
ncbi:MAG TPA: hypothetical protein VNZ61_08675 [Roseomonas sp.]|nr:hypothetical protein [Roseomonas sp.]